MVPCDGPYFMIEPQSLFGRQARLEIEIGAGRGDFIIERAAAAPERDFLAVELAGAVAQLMAARAGRRRLANLRVARMDARALINLMLPEHCIAAYHVYFPDPWPKERHVKHRLFTPYFAASLARTLADGAPLFVASDVADYASAIFAMVEAVGLARVDMPVPGASETGFARKFIAAGRPVYARAFARP
jgi:tRNA (guanine-N7-)-methyltransferase